MKSIKVIVIGFILAIALVAWPVEYTRNITAGTGFLLGGVLAAWLGIRRRKGARKEYEDDVRRYTGTTMMKVVWIEESVVERWEHQEDGSDRPHRETVVLLSHKKPDSYIHIDVEFGEGEGKIPVDKIVQRAEQYKPKERVTYKRIKEYILEKYGFKVHTAYIAEVKRSLGLPMYDAPNAVEKLKQARKHPTPEKVEAIKDALHYFAVI